MTIELKQFRQSLTYTATAPLPVIAASLHEIQELFQIIEVKQKEYHQKAPYYFLGAMGLFVLIFVLIIIASSLNIAPSLVGFVGILLFLGMIGLIIASIYASVMWFKFIKLNLAIYRYEVTNKVLQTLSRDVDKVAEADLYLSFQPIDKTEHTINTIPHPQKAGWKISNHEHQWLKIQGRFLDKTRFQLTANELAKRQHGWKKSSSGNSKKYKSKTKSKGLDISLSLNYPQRRYGEIKNLENTLFEAIKLPSTASVRNVKITDKAIHLLVRINPETVDNSEQIHQTITMMLLSLYQVLNFAKKLAKN
jgi:hypothetical protein